MSSPLRLLVVAAFTASACAPVIETQPTRGLPAGYIKTIRATITPWFTVVGNERVEHDASGALQTATPIAVGNEHHLVLAGSQALPAGQVVQHTWRVNYAPILFPFGASSVETSDQFEVAPPARLTLNPDPVCLRLGEFAPVEVALTPAPPDPQTFTIGLTTNPASVTLPQTASLSVGPDGNSVNLQGLALGEATLTAAAAPFTSESVEVEVIAAFATATLRRPADGDSDVFLGNNPPQGATVPVSFEWDEALGAVGGSQKYNLVVQSADGSEIIDTNNSSDSIVLSLSPGTEYRWRVRARFPSCGGGTEFGPFSEELSFTTFAPQS